MFVCANKGVVVVRLHPQRALRDLSKSLLLDSSVDNVSCYLQRGMLYVDLARQVCPSLSRIHSNHGRKTGFFFSCDRVYCVWCDFLLVVSFSLF